VQKKAEEANKSAKAAVEAFREAAEKSALRVVKDMTEAKNMVRSLRAQRTSLVNRIKSLEKRLTKIESSLPNEKVVLLREISKEEAKKEIRQLFSEGKTLYYSDIAEHLGLDLQLVVEICNELQKSGEIEIDDNALQSR
jgi:oligoendopeptidase F